MIINDHKLGIIGVCVNIPYYIPFVPSIFPHQVVVFLFKSFVVRSCIREIQESTDSLRYFAKKQPRYAMIPEEMSTSPVRLLYLKNSWPIGLMISEDLYRELYDMEWFIKWFGAGRCWDNWIQVCCWKKMRKHETQVIYQHFIISKSGLLRQPDFCSAKLLQTESCWWGLPTGLLSTWWFTASQTSCW